LDYHISLSLSFSPAVAKSHLRKKLASYLLEPMFAGCSFVREPPMKVLTLKKKFIGFPGVGLSFDSFRIGINFKFNNLQARFENRVQFHDTLHTISD
jgi:hypothetical protein